MRSRLAEFASQIRSVTVGISADEAHTVAHRRCDIEVMTHAGQISASSVGVDLFALVDRALDRVVEILGQRTAPHPYAAIRQRSA
jgi:hypothetical protein